MAGDLFAAQRLFDEPTLDRALRGQLTFHDEQVDQWRRDAIVLADRHWQGRFAAAYLLGVIDERLHAVKLRIRNGATFDEVKAMLGEDRIARRPPA